MPVVGAGGSKRQGAEPRIAGSQWRPAGGISNGLSFPVAPSCKPPLASKDAPGCTGWASKAFQLTSYIERWLPPAIPNVPPPGTRLPSFFCPSSIFATRPPLVSFFTTQWRVINRVNIFLISLNFCTCVHGCLHDSELSIIPERWIVILVSFSLPCYNVKYPRQFTKRLPFLLPFP